MTSIQHLSMRVPWRDRPWDAAICDDPLGNSSCTLLANIGIKRDDAYEAANAAVAIEALDPNRLPCLSERATFMSPRGYSVTKEHPYQHNKALRGSLLPTTVSLPGYAFEAVPFRWMSRETLLDEISTGPIAGFDPEAEHRVDEALGFTPSWVMDGANQRAVIDAFFQQVVPQESLVFVYLKHSPLQEQRTDRLLVGAARVSRVTPPPMWNQAGQPPFNSSMWETVVEHSLRLDMLDGILLPYQALVSLLDEGIDIDSALAWAPEGRTLEFSYVTEHLSDDAAIEALGALQRAAEGMVTLGLDIPESGRTWVQAQIERLWQLRGPAPGLPGALRLLGVQSPHVAARVLVELGGDDPWHVLEEAFEHPASAPPAVAAHVGKVQARTWSKLSADQQDALRLLSALDISSEHLRIFFEEDSESGLRVDELLDNPYVMATWTYGAPEHVPFATIDRALFPPPHVTWQSCVPNRVALDGHLDRRRVEALITEVLERQGQQGDTVVPVGEVIALANEIPLSQPPNLSLAILTGLDLDVEGIGEGEWPRVFGRRLSDAMPAFKLVRYEETSAVIREWIDAQERRERLGTVADARHVLDDALERNTLVADDTAEVNDLEERARTEKSEGLSALHDAPLSVLIGPAGTGKTTLLRALVEYPGVDVGGVLLLAPTGKARVQLEQKVGRPAKTLASYLSKTKRYDGDTGRYLVWGADQPRTSCGLVVIDEASMLTEEMLAATLDAFIGVKRLVLVGDPRQLPPIGAGRPFVDLVNKLRPSSFDTWVRVGPSFVELQVPRRQLPDGRQGERHDLELAAWFGDNTRGAGDEAIWDDLAGSADLPTVRYVPWAGRTAIAALSDELMQKFKLDADDPPRIFAQTYGGTVEGTYLNWNLGAGKRAEEWQILTPTRSRAFGTVELNRHIKRSYRESDTRWAQRRASWNIPSPIGPELIVRGDKVMQTVNRKQHGWPRESSMDYVANGEIGVAIGRMAKGYGAKSKMSLKVEFSSQPGFQYSYWPSDGDDAPLELAWAVTVHKSQGSEFGTTFLVLPSRVNVSRELLYTALTRQKDRVVILHEGTLSDLRDLSSPLRSETARRLTDLFTTSTAWSFEVRGASRRFDRNLLHVSASGIPMASKNEVIIAGLLDRLVPGRWAYEQPLTGGDGRTVRPDFTIVTDDSRTVYWEHAGMLDLPDYARKWELKQTWYAENGVTRHDEEVGPNGVLLVTDDRHGANAQAWLELASQVLGVEAGAEAPSGVSRRSPVKRRRAP